MKHQDLTVIKANCLVLTSAMCRCWCQTSSVDWAFLTSSSFTLICRSVTANFRCICLPHGTTSPATVLNKLEEHSGECIWPTTSNPNIRALARLTLQNSSPPNMTVYVKWCQSQKNCRTTGPSPLLGGAQNLITRPLSHVLLTLKMSAKFVDNFLNYLSNMHIINGQ